MSQNISPLSTTPQFSNTQARLGQSWAPSTAPRDAIRSSSKIMPIVWVALGCLFVALAVVIYRSLKGGRVQPQSSPVRLPVRPTGPAAEILDGRSLKEKLQQSSQSTSGPKDHYAEILSAILKVLDKEKGIKGQKAEEEQFVYETYQEYPYALVAVFGGREAFDQIPELAVNESHLYELEVGLKQYLKIKFEEMTHPVMKGPDTLGRRFLAIRHQNKSTGTWGVEIFLCRDPEASRWYLNEEKTPELFSLNRGQAIHFIGRLLRNAHPQYKPIYDSVCQNLNSQQS